MKIVIISRGDASSGGAGRVAEILSEGLKERGHCVTHFVRNHPRVFYKDKCKKLLKLKGDILLRNLAGFDASGLHLLVRKEIKTADIIHFHDFSVSYGELVALKISKIKPTVFTFHDFSGFTGGCLYPDECERYKVGCDQCPKVGKPPLTLPIDLTKRNFKMNKEIAKKTSTFAISPSKYLKEKAECGAWSQSLIEVIPNPVDSEVFTNQLRETGRETLKLAPSHKVLLFVASNVLDPRKGFLDLAEAFILLAKNDNCLNLVTIGSIGRVPDIIMPFKDRVFNLGPIKDHFKLAEIYAASDCFVLPSYQDNFPCTILESLCTGTPVVVYNTGGISEMLVHHPKAGIVVLNRDPISLHEAINNLLRNGITSRERKEIRGSTIKKYSISHFIDKHIKLYERVLLAK